MDDLSATNLESVRVIEPSRPAVFDPSQSTSTQQTDLCHTLADRRPNQSAESLTAPDRWFETYGQEMASPRADAARYPLSRLKRLSRILATPGDSVGIL